MEVSPSISQRASKTAMFAAIHRYLSLFEQCSEFSSHDTMAGLFIPAPIKLLLRFAWFRRHVRRKLHKKVPGTYEYVIARSKCFDEAFVNALHDGMQQIVILGAGYDSRAIRYQSLNQDSRIFELDTEALQSKKKKILARNRISIPDRLIFCPIIFGAETLVHALEKAGYDKTHRTLFMWEGVTYYLTESAVVETLDFINNNSGPDSRLMFDYFYQSVLDGKCEFYGASEISDSVAQIGEPFQFGIEPSMLESFMSEQGFTVLTRYPPEVLERKYLSCKGETLGKVYGFAECVSARLARSRR